MTIEFDGQNNKLGTTTANSVTIKTNDTDVITVDSNQNVGVGTATPTNFGSNFKMLAVEGSDFGVVQSVSNSGSVTTEMMASATLGFIGTRTNHPFVIRTNDTERMRVTDAGLHLGGTGSANALDDYEEGTWTPSLTSSGGSISVSYGTRTGKYTKVGNTVHCSFVMRVASHSGGSGEYRVSGLPFSSSTAGSDHTGVTTAALEGHPFTASTQLLQVIDNNQTYIRLLRGNNDSSWNSYTPQSNNSVYMSFTYPTT